MATEHVTILNAECHEPKHITDAVMADAGKVITPSSVTNGVSTLRKLASTELSDTASIALLTSTQTLTNKRVTRRVSTVTYAANIDVNSDNFDQLQCNSLTGNVIVNAPTGTPTEGQRLTVSLTQDGTGGRTITYDAAFVTTGATVTTLSTTETREFQWHSTRAKWIQLAFTSGI